MSVNCPQCQKDDNIRKVSSVVTGGISTGSYSGPTYSSTYVGEGKYHESYGHSTLNGSTVQEFSRLLAPPAPPKRATTGCVNIIILLFITGTGLFCAANTAPFALMGGRSDGSGVFGLIACALTLGIGFGTFILAKRFLADSNKGVANANKDYPDRLAAWEKQITKWNRLYLCFRDDIVFDPETGKSVPPQLLNELLADQ